MSKIKKINYCKKVFVCVHTYADWKSSHELTGCSEPKNGKRRIFNWTSSQVAWVDEKLSREQIMEDLRVADQMQQAKEEADRLEEERYELRQARIEKRDRLRREKRQRQVAALLEDAGFEIVELHDGKWGRITASITWNGVDLEMEEPTAFGTVEDSAKRFTGDLDLQAAFVKSGREKNDLDSWVTLHRWARWNANSQAHTWLVERVLLNHLDLGASHLCMSYEAEHIKLEGGESYFYLYKKCFDDRMFYLWENLIQPQMDGVEVPEPVRKWIALREQMRAIQEAELKLRELPKAQVEADLRIALDGVRLSEETFKAVLYNVVFRRDVLPKLQELEAEPVVYPLAEMQGVGKGLCKWVRVAGVWRGVTGTEFQLCKQELAAEFRKLLYQHHREAQAKMDGIEQMESIKAKWANDDYWAERLELIEAQAKIFRGGKIVTIPVSNWQHDSKLGVVTSESMDEMTDTSRGLKRRSDGSAWVIDTLGEMQLRRRVHPDYVVVMPYICIEAGDESAEGEKNYGLLRNPMGMGDSEELPENMHVTAQFNSDEYREAVRKIENGLIDQDAA